MISNNQKPCLVKTSQGFSVSYNNRFLYSKYNPSKSILTLVKQVEILSGTIVLCCSPVLNYGLKELSEQLPENCILLGCEFNPDLHQFITENIDSYNSIKNFHFLSIDEVYNLGVILSQNKYTLKSGETICFAGNYKRVIRIDFSAGIQLNSELYNKLQESCVNSIKTFWSNRLTLTTFGRRYCQDFFKNLKILPDTTDINSYIQKITKPIVCFGAGQSINSGINEISLNKKDYFILCTDTSLSSLIAHNIVPDGVFIEEAQFIINRAFIGLQNYNVQYFVGLSAAPQISRYIKKENLCYFTTLFSESDFLKKLQKQNILPPENPPFGSVGLTMVYYAVKFRKDLSVPIFLYGLDFSYSAGLTHGKQTMSHKEKLISNTRLSPVQNYNAAFNKNVIKFLDKKSNVFYTTPSLQNYAFLFNGYFASIKNLFDSSECGIKLNILEKKPVCDNITEIEIKKQKFSNEKATKINEYILSEKRDLIELRDILTGKIELSETELYPKINQLLSAKDYLYIHFPDGFKFEINQSFLNRIRTEIDFFLKFL
ncbi:MAG: DUF115 domain-containing protein [Spirochaetia bacterium]|nr:DUF115 domain-containing protein [Spirochaetia bacterium]